jgi:hypothetical protein
MNYEIGFHNASAHDAEGKKIGRLDFNGGVLKFEGKAEESAQIFIDFLMEKFVGRLKKERERCAQICEQLQDWPEGATPYDCAAAIRSAE